MDTPTRRKIMTVDMAADEIGQSPRTIRRWITNSDPAVVHRETIRLPDPLGRMVRKTVVDVVALRAYGDTL